MSLTQKVSFIKNLDLDRNLNPLLNDAPVKVLEREYLIYTTALAVGAVAIDPYAQLFSNSLITDFLKGFKFFKSGIKLRFVLTSSPLYYGVVSVSWGPEVYVSDSQYGWGNQDPVLIDVAQSDAVVLDIPYVSAEEFLLLPYVTARRLMRLDVAILAYASIDSTAPVPNLMVYASFTKPECFGAHSQMMVAAEKANNALVVGDMLSRGEMQHLNSSREIVPYNSNQSDVVPYQHSVRREHSQALTTMSEAAGTVATVISALAPEVAPVIGGAALAMEMAEYGYDLIASAWEKYQGTTDPDAKLKTEEPEEVKQNVLGNVAGCIYTPSLNMSSNKQEMCPPYHLGEVNFTHRVMDIVKIPTLRNIITLSSSGVPVPIVVEPLRDSTNRPSYMDHWANCFRYWRGSIKVKLIFYTSPLITCTLNVFMLNKAGLEPTTALTDYAYKKLVCVRGTTVVDVLIPFVFNRPWREIETSLATVQSDFVSGLYVQLIQTPTSAGSNTGSVFLLPIIAAGDDFQFKDLCSPIPSGVYPASEAESQMHVRKEFQTSKFESLAGQKPLKLLSCRYEDSLTCEEMSMRFSERAVGNNLYGTLTLAPAYQSAVWYDLFDFVQNSFRYVRGGWRLKTPNISTGFPSIIVPNGLTRHYPVSTTLDGYLWGNGFTSNAASASGGNYLLEFEIPYVNDVDWIPTERAQSPLDNHQYTIKTNVSSISSQWIAAGRDYQLAFLMPPFATMQQYASFYVNTGNSSRIRNRP